MNSSLQISESADALVLSYPLSIALAFGAVLMAIAAFAWLARRRFARGWPIHLAVALAAWATLHVATFRMTFSADAGSAYAFLRHDHTVRWRDAADIYLERSGADWRIVVIDRERRAYPFDVAELTAEERDRVMAYMVDRMPQDAFRAAPELLRREAAQGTRHVNFAADQQI